MADEIAPHGEATTDEGPKVQDAPETDWKAEARKWETRAKENLASAKANEAAAKRLAEFEESQKTEAQKAQERLDAAEKRAQELELKAIRAEVAAESGVPVALLSGSTREEIQASAEALIQFRGEQTPAVSDRASFVIPNEGGSPVTALNGDGLESALRAALGIQ
jgi:hypothetical protein